MHIFIGDAKLMQTTLPRLITGCTDPVFERQANSIAMHLARYSADELKRILRCNGKIALENHFRFRRFVDPATRRPAAFCFDGMVFKKLDADSMTDADLSYANSHLTVGSFLYGMLRPLDLINAYRLEATSVIPTDPPLKMSQFWRPILTDRFIEMVKADDGILVNLASREFRDLFDWKRVEKELTVISPDFKVAKSDVSPTDDAAPTKNITIYAKMCRGAMASWIIRNRIANPDALAEFEYEGFRHLGKGWTFVLP